MQLEWTMESENTWPVFDIVRKNLVFTSSAKLHEITNATIGILRDIAQ